MDGLLMRIRDIDQLGQLKFAAVNLPIFVESINSLIPGVITHFLYHTSYGQSLFCPDHHADCNNDRFYYYPEIPL
jgi:hypothetical protein